MAIANFKIREKTHSSTLFTFIAIGGLLIGTVLIFYYEYQNSPEQLLFIMGLYIVLSLGALGYAKLRARL